MLFWLFVICVFLGVICIICGREMYVHTNYDTARLVILGWLIAVIAAIAVLVSSIVIITNHITADARVASEQRRYDSLTYQLENELYENDNDIGKKALYDEVQQWNENLAYYQTIQDSFWLGIFYPNVFDQFDFISYKQESKQ